MNFEGQLQRFKMIDELIRTGNTGSPKKLAEKLNISESQLYILLNKMKKMGAPIEYSVPDRSYFYTSPVVFFYGFIPENEY